MRKVTNQTIEAFLSGNPFKLGNTEVLFKACLRSGKFPKGDNFTVIELHGSEIAAKDSKDNSIYITNAGYFTNTTKERLNGIPNVSICQKSGKWFLNGVEWDGEWIKVSN